MLRQEDSPITYNLLTEREEHVPLLNKFFDEVRVCQYLITVLCLIARCLNCVASQTGPQVGQLWLHGRIEESHGRQDTVRGQGPHHEEAPESDEPHDQDRPKTQDGIHGW